jgi:hypothetical protein
MELTHTSTEKIIYTKDNQQVAIKVCPPSDVPSFFVFALYKSGSIMQDKIFEDICSYLKIPTLSIAKSAFHVGIEEGSFDEEVCNLFVDTGYCFYGFRYLPSYLKNFELERFKKILLIRDPRDILVSHYFSMGKSHVIPTGQIGDRLLKQREQVLKVEIDEYVIQQAPVFRNLFRQYTRIEDNQFKLFRYEDVVFDKNKWIEDILEFLELEIEGNKIREIADKHNIFPKEENIFSHIRKVTPGDYKEKLKPATIEIINEIFKEILMKYDYNLN